MRLRNAIQLRMSDESEANVRKAALMQGLPPSTYARLAVEQQAKRDLLQKDTSDGQD